ncbi:MAG: hypothetical protein RBR68_14185 [Tenuifilaceae bacterium]|nr:hypothetical protein [Tenuifilaceae bacterium]
MAVKEWKYYLDGIQYNQSLSVDGKGYYEQVDANIAFANGDQWRNVKADDIAKPVVPIIQKAKQHTIANICSTSISATINPLEYSSKEDKRTPEMEKAIEVTDMANAEIRNIFDDIKFEFKIREGLSDAYDAGDMALHFYWDAYDRPYKGKYKKYEGKICSELVDGVNVMFGNPNCADPQKQPYILVVGRDLTKTLKKEAEEYAKQSKQDMMDTIMSDYDYQYQAADEGKIELESDKYGKSLYVIMYKKDKKTGKVMATKFTETAYIYKDVDTEYEVYPIAWMNYKKQKNTYHGRAAVTGLIPNQISVNKLLAMIIYSVMKTAFPTMIYDAKRMSAPSNKVGKAIGVKLQPGESLRDVATYLETGQVSPQVIQVIDLMMTYTKDMLGINDAAVGNVNPDNTSAIALAEKLTAVPLENVRSNLYEFTEQCVEIILDMIGCKYGRRPVVIRDGDDTQIIEFNFDKLRDLNYSKRVDVGAIGYASELSSIKELKELLNLGAITVVDYLERLPEYQVPKVKELIEEIKERTGMISAQEQQEKEATWEQMMAFMETLPQEIQDQLRTLTDEQLEAQLLQLMEQAPEMAQQGQQEQEINQMLMGGQ